MKGVQLPPPPPSSQPPQQNAPAPQPSQNTTATEIHIHFSQDHAGNSSGARTQNKNKKAKQNTNHSLEYKPFRSILVMAGVLAVCTAVTLVQTAGSRFSASAYIEDGQALSQNVMTLSDDSYWFTDSGELVYVTKVSKKDPYTRTYSSSLEVKDSMGNYYDDWVSIPLMDFGVEDVWVSTVMDLTYSGTAGEGNPSGYFEDGDTTWVDVLQDYDWYADKDNPTDEEILRGLKQAGAIESVYAEVLDDGSSTGSGIVRFSVMNTQEDQDYLSADINLIFKKDGKVIFADTKSVSEQGKRKTFEEIYHSPVSFPDGYDEVEIAVIG